MKCLEPNEVSSILRAFFKRRELPQNGSGESCAFFSQGGLADAIFFLDSGRATLTVVSARGKEATVTTLAPGDFIGEESLAGGNELHNATATAVTPCNALKLSRKEMVLLLHEQHEFSDIFLKFVLLRGVRTRDDLIDHLFNNSEKRLARNLLIMAEFGKPGEPESVIPPVTQEELADMIGTTRSRVSKFMNNFRKLRYIDYSGGGRIHVRKALLDVVLHDRLPDQTANRPVVVDHEETPAHERNHAKVVCPALKRGFTHRLVKHFLDSLMPP